MELIIGGAYQGKLEYAAKTYNLKETDIYVCAEDTAIDFDKKCVYGIEEFVMYCLKRGLSAREILEEKICLSLTRIATRCMPSR